MLRPPIHRTLGAIASGRAPTSWLNDNGFRSSGEKIGGCHAREISVTEQLGTGRCNPKAHDNSIVAARPSSETDGVALTPTDHCRIVTPIQPIRVQAEDLQPVRMRCRFEMTAADALFSHEFCAFEFPGCEGCPNAPDSNRTAESPEDPMKSKTWQGWIAHTCSPPRIDSCTEEEERHGRVHSPGESRPVQETPRRACGDAQRQLLLKLLAEEEAREPSFLTQHSPQSDAPAV